MAYLLEKAHFIDKETLGRMNRAVVLGLIGSGVLACAVGALIYDVSRLFSLW